MKRKLQFRSIVTANRSVCALDENGEVWILEGKFWEKTFTPEVEYEPGPVDPFTGRPLPLKPSGNGQRY